MSKIDNDFINLVKENYPKNYEKIVSAYLYANDAHDGVKRKSGEPYITHPLEVAKILIEINMDYSTIIAGLLHDVVEDTTISNEVIKQKFGETVAKLVDAVTKIDNLTLKQNNLQEADNMKRLLIAMGSDIRVIFIKLADRLHNMRTISFLSRDRQIRMAEETMEIFIPIAERIGLRKLRAELQNLVFECLNPEEYGKIKSEFDKIYEGRMQNVVAIENSISKIMKENDLNASVDYWFEDYYSIYKKLSRDGLSKIRGLIYIKVILDSELDCYKALGVIHKNFSPLPGQLQDYIAQPKPNGYKSLQSAVISNELNLTFKVMLRTKEMNEVCEYGIASLWRDKDADVETQETYEKYNSLKEIIYNESGDIGNALSFINAIRADLFSTSTWVFTPNFKAICLSAERPTAIDFAYAIHSNIGDNAIGAVVNGKKAALSTELKSGDVVEIMISDKPKAPSRSWLSFAKTSSARNKIKEYIKKHTTEKFIEKGKKLLGEALKGTDFAVGDVIAIFDQIKNEFNFVDTNDMFASIGYESITVQQISAILEQRANEENCKKNSPVTVEGSANFSNLSFARCCSAIPGDEIVGVLSKNGVVVHQKDCPNLKRMEKAQIVSCKWKDSINKKFNVNLKITAVDEVGIASKIISLISNKKIYFSKIEAKTTSKDECEFELSFEIDCKNSLNDLIVKLKSLGKVKSITRFFE